MHQLNIFGIEEWSSSPYTSHFSQPDTIIPDQTNPQSWDRYSYTLNNPIRYIDPSGHVTCEGSNWDDGPHCLKKSNSTLSIVVAKTKYQKYCTAGKNAACPGGTKGMVVFGAAAIGTAGLGEDALLGGAAADLAEAGLTKAALACLQNAVCRTVFGMAGGASTSGQDLIDDIVQNEFQNVKLSQYPQYDSNLPPDVYGEAMKDTYTKIGSSAINEGRAETIITIAHEETHHRLWERMWEQSEQYVEDVAQRFARMLGY